MRSPLYLNKNGIVCCQKEFNCLVCSLKFMTGLFGLATLQSRIDAHLIDYVVILGSAYQAILNATLPVVGFELRGHCLTSKSNHVRHFVHQQRN